MALVAKHAPDAIPVLFGHIGEGNVHVNLVRCALDRDRERELCSAMMELITRRSGGNDNSEHGVGTRKRDYLGDVAHRRRYRGDARRQGRLRPVRLPQCRGAFGSSRSRHRQCRHECLP